MASIRKQMKLPGSFELAWSATYPANGYDPINETFNGQMMRGNTSREGLVEDWGFVSDPLSLATSFLGIPNSKLEEKQSLKNIGKNLIGWPKSDASMGKKIFRGILAPVTLAWNLLMVPLKLTINTAKLVTEFLPAYGSKLALKASLQAERKIKNIINVPTKLKAKLIGARAAVYICETLLFIGRAVTSPIKGIRTGINLGNRLGSETVMENDAESNLQIEVRKNTKRGRILGVTLAITSGLITAAVYSVLFPLGIKFLAANVVPALPSAVTSIVSTAVKFAAPVLTPVGNVIAHAMSTVGMAIAPALKAIGIQASPVVTGVSATLASFIPAIGFAKTIKNVVSSWWHKRKEAKKHKVDLGDGKNSEEIQPLKEEQQTLLVDTPVSKNSHAHINGRLAENGTSIQTREEEKKLRQSMAKYRPIVENNKVEVKNHKNTLRRCGNFGTYAGGRQKQSVDPDNKKRFSSFHK